MTLKVDLAHRLGAFSLQATFDAPPGVTALFGRSGAGKTTIVNAIAGLLRPDRGQVRIGNRLILDTETGLFIPPHRRRIGYVFQDARLFPHLSVRRNIGYGQWFAPRRGSTAETNRIVDLLGIGAILDRRPGALSGGEKQRVALARAILSRPEMLLMDEPLSALDEARKAEVLPYLERLRDNLGLPILYVSHNAAEIARLATTVVLLDQGRVIAAGPVADILSDPASGTAFGARETGAILTATVAAQEPDGLTRLAISAGALWLPKITATVGHSLRLRIMAQDIMLSRDHPVGISALNILAATIRDILPEEGSSVLVRLDIGPDVLLARITRRSAQALALAPGQTIHAVIKAVSVARDAPGLQPGST